ncbi:MAG TPA: hypothetical protein VLE72_00345 [Candidatus Saccharimonadales bacterium]|nr:hypothetical protein [Candidatus Saccharimonadales bacterium]
MFRKIVSNLNLSPSAGSQLTFYLRRLQKEGATRRLALVFAVGLVVLQIATIISPASASHQPSTNDIIYGGLTSSNPKADLLTIYDQNHDSAGHTGYQNLFKYFGITRDDITRASVTTINSSDHSLHSIGREHRFADDQAISVDGQTYYYRSLFEWGDHVSYSAVTGTRADGSFFAVLVDCGNIVVRSIPIQPPKLQLSKTVLPGMPAADSQVPPGANLGYRLFYKNNGAGIAHTMVIEDPVPDHTTVKWQGGGTPFFDQDSNPVPTLGRVDHVWWMQPQVVSGFSGYVDFTVTINNDTPNNTRICNYAYIRSQEIPISKSAPICYTVVKEAPPPPPPPPPPKNPKLILSKGVKNLTTNNGDANHSTVHAGDILEYRLVTRNTGDGVEKAYRTSEDIGDILAYTDVVQLNGGTLSGGHLSWAAADIAPGTAQTKIFQVKVKNPIPTTAAIKADPKLNDCTLDNVYGNSGVSVKVACPPPKTIETTIEKLPQTGASTTSILTFALVGGMVFFYLRNRQLVRELKMLRVDNVTG